MSSSQSPCLWSASLGTQSRSRERLLFRLQSRPTPIKHDFYDLHSDPSAFGLQCHSRATRSKLARYHHLHQIPSHPLLDKVQSRRDAQRSVACLTILPDGTKNAETQRATMHQVARSERVRKKIEPAEQLLFFPLKDDPTRTIQIGALLSKPYRDDFSTSYAKMQISSPG